MTPFRDRVLASPYDHRTRPLELDSRSTVGPAPTATIPGTSVTAPSMLPWREVCHSTWPLDGLSATSVPTHEDPFTVSPATTTGDPGPAQAEEEMVSTPPHV